MINARLKTIRSKIYSRLMSSPNLVATFLVGWLNRLFGFKKLSQRLFFDFSSHCSRTFSRWSRKNARNVIKRTGIFLKKLYNSRQQWLVEFLQKPCHAAFWQLYGTAWSQKNNVQLNNEEAYKAYKITLILNFY